MCACQCTINLDNWCEVRRVCNKFLFSTIEVQISIIYIEKITINIFHSNRIRIIRVQRFFSYLSTYI